eukprot:TRINITY_DN50619_c0_g1_i1.p1 TRINITY_DN50619_c0_g1~~TRINITY_DN50619_c0_g1_i1.p1  ORF type:complete len:102 (-),score=5.33 TRINITY_DN50619_c0_g1_i1:301-606(-)
MKMSIIRIMMPRNRTIMIPKSMIDSVQVTSPGRMHELADHRTNEISGQALDRYIAHPLISNMILDDSRVTTNSLKLIIYYSAQIESQQTWHQEDPCIFLNS